MMMVHALMNNLMNVVYVVVTIITVQIQKVNVFVQDVLMKMLATTVHSPPLIIIPVIMKEIMIVMETV